MPEAGRAHSADVGKIISSGDQRDFWGRDLNRVVTKGEFYPSLKFKG